MATEAEIRRSGRDRCISAAMDGIEDVVSADAAAIFQQAVAAVDALVDDVHLFTAERWDEDCHDCEQPIRDHRVDGRCPDFAEPQSPDPTPGESS